MRGRSHWLCFQRAKNIEMLDFHLDFQDGIYKMVRRAYPTITDPVEGWLEERYSTSQRHWVTLASLANSTYTPLRDQCGWGCFCPGFPDVGPPRVARTTCCLRCEATRGSSQRVESSSVVITYRNLFSFGPGRQPDWAAGLLDAFPFFRMGQLPWESLSAPGGKFGLTNIRADGMAHSENASSKRFVSHRIFRAPVAQLDRASDFESAGRPFESGRARQSSQWISGKT